MIRLGYALSFVAIFVLLLPLGCVGTETGNPPATEVDVVSPSPDVVPPAEVDAAVIERASELGVAYLSLAGVELVPDGACGPLATAADAVVAGAVAVEWAATGTFTPPPGTYCGIRLWPTPAPDDATVPPLLRGHTFAVHFKTETGADYVTLQSDRTAPIVLLATSGSFTVPEGAATATLLVDAANALLASEFWLQPAEPDGSWFFDEAGDASFLRLFESTASLFRLALLSGTASAADGGSGTGGGAGGGAGTGGGTGGALDPALGIEVAASP